MKANILLTITLLMLFILPSAMARAPFLEQEYAPGTLIVKLDGSRSLEEAETMLKSADRSIISAEYLFGSSENLNSKAKRLDMDRFLIIEVDETIDHIKLANKLFKLRSVENVELNYIYDPLSIPDDEYFPANQWGLHNYGQEIFPGSGVYGTPDIDIDAPEAWNIETGSSDIIIASLDSGVNYNHEDLQNKMWVNIDEIPDNGIDDDNNSFVDDIMGWDTYMEDNDPIDENGHGTRVAGAAGAETNNGIGVASLCQGCTIMPIRVGGMTYYTSNIVQGVYYAADNGANVISMSFGRTDSDCISTSFDTAIQYAHDMGIVFAGAAGNDEGNTAYMHPACRPEVIGVAGYNHNGGLSMSRHGEWIDVAAPGTFIISTTMSGGYDYAGGTSMATPFVSGLAGLLLSSFEDITPSQIREIMMLTAEELYGDEPINPDGGRINAHDALSVCIVEDGIFLSDVCIADNAPAMCIEQKIVSNCQECGCPENRLCEPDGRCIKEGKPRLATRWVPI
ncbi:MAG: S8 family peptidase [archaeon]